MFRKNIFKSNSSKSYVISRFVVEFLIKAGNIISFPLFVKFLGSSSYGVFIQLSAITGVIVPIATLGLGFDIVRRIKGLTDKLYFRSHLTTTLLLTSVVSGFIGLLILIFSSTFNHLFIKIAWADPVIKISVLWIIFSCLDSLVSNYFRALLKISLQSVTEISQLILNLTGSFYILIHKGNLLQVVLWQTLMIFIFVFCKTLYLYRLTGLNLKINFLSSGEIKSMLRFGYPMVMMGLGSWALSLADRYVIGYFFSATTAGIYGAAYSLASLIGMLGAPFWYSVYPLMSRHFPDFMQISIIVKKYVNSFLFISVPTMVGIFILGPRALLFMGNRDFIVSNIIFAILVLGIFADQISAVLQYTLYLQSDTKFIRNITLLSGLLNILVNIALVPKLGILGAAIATFISYSVLSLGTYLKVRSLTTPVFGFFNHKLGVKIILASIGMGFVILLTQPYLTVAYPMSFIFTVLIGLLVYVTFLAVFYGFKYKKLLFDLTSK